MTTQKKGKTVSQLTEEALESQNKPSEGGVEITGDMIADTFNHEKPKTDTQIITLIAKAAIEKTKAQIILDKFQTYITQAAAWEEKIKEYIVTDESETDKMEKAKEVRLALKEIRVSANKTREKAKEQSLREGQVIDGIYKVIAGLVCPMEDLMEESEKFLENKEKERREELRKTRVAMLRPYMGNDAELVPVVDMAEENFNAMLQGYKLAKEKKDDEDLKAKQDKEADDNKIKAENEKLKVYQERLLKLTNLGVTVNGSKMILANDQATDDADCPNHIIMDVSGLDAVGEESEAFFQETVLKKFSDFAELIKAWKEKEKAKTDKLKSDRLKVRLKRIMDIPFTRRGLDKIYHQPDDKTPEFTMFVTKIAECSDAEFEKAIKIVTERNEEAQKKADAAAKRKAARAPDREKLIALAKDFGMVRIPTLSDKEAQVITANVVTLVQKLQQYITANADKL